MIRHREIINHYHYLMDNFTSTYSKNYISQNFKSHLIRNTDIVMDKVTIIN